MELKFKTVGNFQRGAKDMQLPFPRVSADLGSRLVVGTLGLDQAGQRNQQTFCGSHGAKITRLGT